MFVNSPTLGSNSVHFNISSFCHFGFWSSLSKIQPKPITEITTDTATKTTTPSHPVTFYSFTNVTIDWQLIPLLILPETKDLF